MEGVRRRTRHMVNQYIGEAGNDNGYKRGNDSERNVRNKKIRPALKPKLILVHFFPHSILDFDSKQMVGLN